MKSRIWRHTNGRRYAVALDSYSDIVGVLGPLADADIPHALNGQWDSNGRDLLWIRHNRDQFTDITDQLLRERDRRLLRAAE